MCPAPSAAVPLPPALAPALLRWYRLHRRRLPWRVDRDPYGVWVAEVLLQQTRVAHATPYFERFLRAFPTVSALARAPADRVLKVWQGVGYYARAHRLHTAARWLVRERGGRIPSTVPELEALPGVGPYIARAVAAIAFGRRCVALEANGLRVAARWTREERDVREPRVRARLERALDAILPRSDPGAFNEAVMELGETICRPSRPDCAACPVAFACRAYRELDEPGSLPIRPKRGRRPNVRAAVVVLNDHGRWLVQRRPAAGLLPGLWEFPGGRIERGETPEAAARRELREETGLQVRTLVRLGTVRHAYSHFTVELHAYAGRHRGRPGAAAGARRRWVTPSELSRLPVPKATEKVVALAEQATGTDGMRPRTASRGNESQRSTPRNQTPPRNPARGPGGSGGRGRRPEGVDRFDEVADRERADEGRPGPGLTGPGLEPRVGARKDHERAEVRPRAQHRGERLRPRLAFRGAGVEDEDLRLGRRGEPVDRLPGRGLEEDPVAVEAQEAAQQKTGVLAPSQNDRRGTARRWRNRGRRRAGGLLGGG